MTLFFFFSSLQVNLSDYNSAVISPLEITINFCGGFCDSASIDQLKINSWIHFSEYQKQPGSLSSLCCVPNLYKTITIIEQDENIMILKSILNFSAASCTCV